jgi:hypothetical protein
VDRGPGIILRYRELAEFIVYRASFTILIIWAAAYKAWLSILITTAGSLEVRISGTLNIIEPKSDSLEGAYYP